MPLADYLASTLAKLVLHYHQMGRAIEPPIRVKIGSQMFFRHQQCSDVLLCYLKGVKLVSTLNAPLVPPYFHMSGMLGTPRMPEWENQLVTYVYRAIMATEVISRKLALPDSEKEIRSLLVECETALNCKPTESAEAMLCKAKKK